MIEHSGDISNALGQQYSRFVQKQGEARSVELVNGLTLESRTIQSGRKKRGSAPFNTVSEVYVLSDGKPWVWRRIEVVNSDEQHFESTTWLLRNELNGGGFVGRIDINKVKSFVAEDDEGRSAESNTTERMALSIYPDGSKQYLPRVFYRLGHRTKDVRGRSLESPKAVFEYSERKTLHDLLVNPLRDDLAESLTATDLVIDKGRKIETINPLHTGGISRASYPKDIKYELWMLNLTNGRDEVIENPTIPTRNWFDRLGIWVEFQKERAY